MVAEVTTVCHEASFFSLSKCLSRVFSLMLLLMFLFVVFCVCAMCIIPPPPFLSKLFITCMNGGSVRFDVRKVFLFLMENLILFYHSNGIIVRCRGDWSKVEWNFSITSE